MFQSPLFIRTSTNIDAVSYISKRNVSNIIIRLATRLFKLRYIVFGAGVGGTYHLSKKYDDFKSSLPDISIFNDYIPNESKLGENLEKVKTLVSHANELQKNYFERFKSVFHEKFQFYNAENPSSESAATVLMESEKKEGDIDKKQYKPNNYISPEEMNNILLKSELSFQKRIESLISENKILRQQLLIRSLKTKGVIKKSLIEMYSEVLDELSDFDSGYKSQDQLPRVVVVGDQSAGKTSVLEMIIQARIFPRGSGEMMTRSPVKVTLSEGPYHIASFKDDVKEFDLTKESELAALRKEIEMRMRSLVSGGKTISSEVISLNVKGPGLQRMVLVDLPGIISTVTTGMQSNTREIIQNMAQYYMNNPNAIILCIQDGSIDAERSNVTELVSTIDPSGKRTIFVLTKVDLAESNLLNPNRIKQILQGKLFPMKALGYFAVVTGKGTKDESIESIKQYEEEFFKRSRLFREGALQLSQMTTANLSKAVSERFWKMVKDSVEQQADSYRALRYNLETEWKNLFPHCRVMDREELFVKGRNEILDDLITLNSINATEWEKNLIDNLWKELKPHVLKNIFQPAQHIEDLRTFHTNIDIWLRDWIENQLPVSSIKAGLQTLYNELDKKLKLVRNVPGKDNIFDHLKTAVHQDTRSRHHWDPKAESRLRIIQANALEDRMVYTKTQWDGAIAFMEKILKSELLEVKQQLATLCGPSFLERYYRWTDRTSEERAFVETLKEIENLISGLQKPNAHITPDDVTTVRRNLQSRKVNTTDEIIRKAWEPAVECILLERALYNCAECRKSFYYYQQGFLNNTFGNGELSKSDSNHRQNMSKLVSTEFTDCRDVIFFARLIKMLEATANALRQQIMNNEALRLEHYVKQVLNDISNDPIKLRNLLDDRRVHLADELKRTVYLQEKLEEFIVALNKGE